MARTLNGNLCGAAAHKTLDDLYPETSELARLDRLAITRDVLVKNIQNAMTWPVRADLLSRWQRELDGIQAIFDAEIQWQAEADAQAADAADYAATIESVRPF
jgi:hypothetical protein